MQKLRECPFCGAKPHPWTGKIKEQVNSGEKYQDRGFICPHGCAHVHADNVDTALKRWNTRHSDKLLERALEALTECHEAMSYMSEYDIPLCMPDRTKAAKEAIENHFKEGV